MADYDFDPNSSHKTEHWADCSVCGRTTSIEVSHYRYYLWKNPSAKKSVHDVWPHVSRDLRELLISGRHPECVDVAEKIDTWGEEVVSPFTGVEDLTTEDLNF